MPNSSVQEICTSEQSYLRKLRILEEVREREREGERGREGGRERGREGEGGRGRERMLTENADREC